MAAIAGFFSASPMTPASLGLRELQLRGGGGSASSTDGATYLWLCSNRLPAGDSDATIIEHRQCRVVVDGFVDYPRASVAASAAAIAAAFATGGAEAVRLLPGSYAAAIADGNQLVIARDRYGSRPLYYTIDASRRAVLFSSEIKGLLSDPDSEPAIDTSRMCDLLVHGHPVGRGTCLQGIFSVLPGESISFTMEREQIRIRYHASPIGYASQAIDTNEDELLNAVCQALRIATERSMDDGCTAVALSGGLDSSVIALIASQVPEREVVALSLLSDSTGDDHRVSRDIAAGSGLRYHEVSVTLDDYLAAIQDVIAARELPTLSGLTIYSVCRGAREFSDVCLNGFGAGELFGERNRYIGWDALCARVRGRLRLAEKSGFGITSECAAVADTFLTAPDYESFLRHFDPCAREWYFRPIDTCSSVVGVETRLPFYDPDLCALMESAPEKLKDDRVAGTDKYLLKRAALRLFGDALTVPVLRRKQPLPEAVAGHADQFDAMCEARLPDHYASNHKFGALFESKQKLLLIDLFEWLFVRRRGHLDSGFSIEQFMSDAAHS